MDSADQEISPNTQPQPQVTPIIPKKILSNNPLVIRLFLLVLILFLVIGFLGYQNFKLQKLLTTVTTNAISSPSPSPTPDLTADWKTYENKDYDFSFRYPDVGYSICLETNFFSIFEEKDLNCDGIIYEIPLVGFRNYYTVDFSKETPISSRIFSIDNVQINIDKYQFIRTGSGVSTTNIIEIATIPSGNTNVELYAFGNESNFQKSQDLLDQILSTLKFTKQTAGVTISFQEAVDIVNNLPEVKSFIAQTTNGVVSIDEMESTDKYWVIQVYEKFSDHNATFNWYHVDKITGEATKQI